MLLWRWEEQENGTNKLQNVKWHFYYSFYNLKYVILILERRDNVQLNYKNARISYDFKRTSNMDGLANGDYWLMVDFCVETDDFTYHSNRESLSYNEVIEAASIIRNLYEGPFPNKQKITFIKNYFKIYLKNTATKRQMTFELINLEDTKRASYKVYFYDKEILDFVNLSNNIS